MLGTAARYALAEAFPTAKDGWPIATLLVNLAGAFVLGLLLEGLVRRGPDVGLRRQLRLFAGTGFCGGFTTYSALAVELDILLRDQQLGTAGGYAGVTLVGGALVTVLGIFIAASHHRWRSARLPPDPDVIEESA
jgi:CrcB protein